MLVRWPALALAASVLALAGCGDSSDDTTTTALKSGATKGISGPWTGKLTQADLKPFKVAVTISGDGTGLVGYTGIDCGGTWSLESAQPPHYVFTEDIHVGKGGKCKGTGTVDLNQTTSGRMAYRFEGGGVTSGGTLTTASVSEVTSVFRKARVQFGQADLNSGQSRQG